MTLDLDTFLTIVYCMVDTVYHSSFAAARPRRPGCDGYELHPHRNQGIL